MTAVGAVVSAVDVVQLERGLQPPVFDVGLAAAAGSVATISDTNITPMNNVAENRPNRAFCRKEARTSRHPFAKCRKCWRVQETASLPGYGLYSGPEGVLPSMSALVLSVPQALQTS